jgi:hypothetical protein
MEQRISLFHGAYSYGQVWDEEAGCEIYFTEGVMVRAWPVCPRHLKGRVAAFSLFFRLGQGILPSFQVPPFESQAAWI